MNNIKAIFFDYDNTLGDRYTAAYNTYREMMETFLDLTEMDEVEQEAMLQDFLTYDQLGNVTTDYSIKRIEKKYHVQFHLEEPYKWWNVHHAQNAVLFPDTVDTLLKLKEKYRIGIITNGQVNGQGGKIMKTGLDKIVDDYVISDQYHVNKPDPRLFEIACERMNVLPKESVYVGDTFGNDVLGAYRAGMVPVWMWPDNETRPLRAGIRRIHRLSDLLEFL